MSQTRDHLYRRLRQEIPNIQRNGDEGVTPQYIAFSTPISKLENEKKKI